MPLRDVVIIVPVTARSDVTRGLERLPLKQFVSIHTCLVSFLIYCIYLFLVLDGVTDLSVSVGEGQNDWLTIFIFPGTTP